MIFVTLYKLKKKEEKCSYIVVLKRCLVIRISRILYLTASGFFIFFLFPPVKCSCLPWGLMQGSYGGMHSNSQSVLPELAFWWVSICGRSYYYYFHAAQLGGSPFPDQGLNLVTAVKALICNR